ncbi:hypothetical protein PPYR_06441 [Photinus pyralis]|uniref:Amine oxidase domain-containing protein n=1 Tax=Photinus pyralis TaxID=7054 RepID=A0A5N4ATK4_PHOPY|nr:probable polyamine oxidase 5 isoform X1 [Photinus pyralis]XP_031337724.1 probable polyamine oxidase 5 isoform X1 [Photinus pyralis]KAB0800702.1 hypothetical protein PPYR_06441 [Photinus pyralis]
MNNLHTIIIGAGAAGIAASSRLLENNIQNILILEARDRIGGRIHTIEVDGSALDFGAQWCHGEENNIVYTLAKDLDVLSHSKNEYNSFNVYSPTLNLDKDVVNQLIPIAVTIMDDTEALQNSTENFGDYFEKRFLAEMKTDFENKLSPQVTTALMDWFHKFVKCLNACPTWYTLSAKGLVHYEVCDGNYYHQWRNRGYKTILEILMREFPDPRKKLPISQKILLNKIVSKIITDKSDGVTVICSDGTKYSARYVLVTLPLGVLKEIHNSLFEPQLPSHKVNAINGLGFGTVNKILIKFPFQWWQRDEKGVSIVWSEKDRDNVLREFPSTMLQSRKSWLESVMGFYPIDSHTNILLVWLVGSSLEEIEKLSDDKIIAGLMFVLKYFIGSRYPDLPNPISVICSKWYSDPYTRGSYSYRSLISDDMNVFASDLAEPIHLNNKSLLMFAGEATSSHQYSTVHGAISSGFREADRIINVCKTEPKSKL